MIHIEVVKMDYSELASFADYLADEAAIISRKYFRQSLAIDSKENCTPVTIADQEIELRLRELIHARYPKHGIIGEEFANQNLKAEFIWVLDPIDGTVAFTTGKPTFTTLIALLHHDAPVLSVINQPISNERFRAQVGQPAQLNQQPIYANQHILALGQARLNATTPYMFKTNQEQQCFERLRKQVKLTSFGGDAYAFGLLAAGHIDIIMEADLQYYDVAALMPIIEAAGGVISDWQGNPLTQRFNGQCLACANLEIQRQVLTVINSN
jgi:histidinol phosphatase-like enzyme (inositol monophosphatase family)